MSAPVWGVLAQFDTPEALLAAARKARDRGYRRIEAYTPFPIEGLSEAVGHRATRLPIVVLIGGVVGALGGYGLQYFAMAVSYPLNVGGKPFHSWPAFVPVTFEFTVLAAALSAVFGMMAMNGFPEPYHPLFNSPAFALGSRDRFFLCVEASDARFNASEVREFLSTLNPQEIHDVPE